MPCSSLPIFGLQLSGFLQEEIHQCKQTQAWKHTWVFQELRIWSLLSLMLQVKEVNIMQLHPISIGKLLHRKNGTESALADCLGFQAQLSRPAEGIGMRRGREALAPTTDYFTIQSWNWSRDRRAENRQGSGFDYCINPQTISSENFHRVINNSVLSI